MKNWKTTVIGALLASAYVLQEVIKNGASLSDWQTWIIPVLIAALGYFAKDAGVTGPVKVLALFGVLSFLLPSCSMSVGSNGKPVFGIDPVALAQTIQLWQQKNGGSKDASVVIVDASGKAITAASVSPAGTVTSTTIPPELAKGTSPPMDPVTVAQNIQAVQKSSSSKEANVIVVDSAGRGVSSINVNAKGVVTTEAFSPPP